MNKTEPLKLGGQTFRHIELSTIEQDYWLMARVREAGLTDFSKYEGEGEDDFSNRLMDGLINGGQGFQIIGGLILPVETKDMDWTPELAEKTADHLRKLTDPGEKQVVHGMIATAFVRFFQDGLLLSKLSELRSKQKGAKGQPANPSPAPADHTETGPG